MIFAAAELFFFAILRRSAAAAAADIDFAYIIYADAFHLFLH